MLALSSRRTFINTTNKINPDKSIINIKISSKKTSKIKSDEPRLITKLINNFNKPWQLFLNGLPAEEKNYLEKNNDQLKEYYDVLNVQQSFYEDLLDGSNFHRFDELSHSGENLIRFDNNPKSNISFRECESKISPNLIYIEGVLKSQLNEKGQLVPVAPLPEEIFFEHHPKTLANLAYQHVMSLNKNRFSIQVENNLSLKKIEEMKAPEVEKLHQKTKAGSPFTSFTKNPPMKEKLAQWGAAGERIEISTTQLKALPPSKLAYLIMHHANVDGIDQLSNKKWREDKGCFASIDCDAVKTMEKKLKAIGVDPDGAWTKREVAVFYVLVADEHLVIGMTPEGSAKIVECKKESA